MKNMGEFVVEFGLKFQVIVEKAQKRSGAVRGARSRFVREMPESTLR